MRHFNELGEFVPRDKTPGQSVCIRESVSHGHSLLYGTAKWDSKMGQQISDFFDPKIEVEKRRAKTLLGGDE